jgi:protein ImuB
VWLRRLATDRLTRIRSSAPAENAPLVIAAEVKSALRLSAVNDAAARLGLKAGMALADARAMYPTIAVAEADPEADRNLLEAIADWCDRYTPLVGLDPPDGLLFDITGCAHLFGGEAALCRDIVQRLAAQDFHARVAVADTVGCSWAVARYAEYLPPSESAVSNVICGGATAFPPPLRGRDREGGTSGFNLRGHPSPHPSPSRGEGAGRVCGPAVPSEQTQDVLLPLPLAALRIRRETVDDLAQVGLKRIADVIDRPRAPLAARFGEDFVRRLDQAMGRDDEPITPRLPIPPYVTERRFPEPIALEADVLATIEHLAQELGRLLERRGEGARGLQAALFRTDGKVHRIVVGTGAPLRDGARMRALFAERLAAIGDACDPGFGFDVIRLCAFASERSDPAQTGLAAPDHATELAHLIDRLGARFGLRRITRLVPQDTHIPEFAVMAVAAHAALRSPPSTRALARGGEGSEVGGIDSPRSQVLRMPHRRSPPPPTPPHHSLREWEEGSEAHHAERNSQDGDLLQDSLAPIRPIRLFEKPERIEAIAQVPDGPPMQFTWRQVTYHIIHAEGPERIAMEWWRDDQGRKLTRDYFRVESKEGIRVWLYRDGPYIPNPERSQWYIHGLFA